MLARQLVLSFLVLLPALACGEQRLTVAVASNFQTTARELASIFRAETGADVRISAGSTGKLYGQIVNGAPFDVFLAADADRPRRLEESGDGVSGTRRTYAIGTLVLWSRDPAFESEDCRGALQRLGRRKLAIANPQTAPFGMAARQFLVAADLWDSLRPSLVIGENVSQTLHFVSTGNASLGFVAGSMTLNPVLPDATCSWRVPQEMHSPIEQQVILLQRGKHAPLARQFVEFLASDEARRVIERAGYRLPEPNA